VAIRNIRTHATGKDWTGLLVEGQLAINMADGTITIANGADLVKFTANAVGPTAPATPTDGMVWHEINNANGLEHTKIWWDKDSGPQWHIAGPEASPTAPTEPSKGKVWYDTSAGSGNIVTKIWWDFGSGFAWEIV